MDKILHSDDYIKMMRGDGWDSSRPAKFDYDVRSGDFSDLKMALEQPMYTSVYIPPGIYTPNTEDLVKIANIPNGNAIIYIKYMKYVEGNLLDKPKILVDNVENICVDPTNISADTTIIKMVNGRHFMGIELGDGRMDHYFTGESHAILASSVFGATS